MLLDGELEAGDRVSVGSRDGQLSFTVGEGDGVTSDADWREPTPAERVTTGGPSAPRLGE